MSFNRIDSVKGDSIEILLRQLLDDFYLNYHVEEDSLVSDSLGQINTAIENLNKRLESIINHSKKID